MEYFVLMATLIVLFFGLLFFIKSFPAPWIETAAVWIALIVIVLSLVFVVLMVVNDVLTRIKTDRAKKRKLRKELIAKFGEEQAKKHLKEYESNLFTKSIKTIIEDLDEGNEDDQWTIVENEYAKVVQEEMLQFREEDWYYDGLVDINLIEEEERWSIVENKFRKALSSDDEEDDNWVVHQNPLNQQNEFEYNQLEMKIYHIDFTLPFFEDEQQESSDEEPSRTLNELLDNLFSKRRFDKKKEEFKKAFNNIKRKLKKKKEEDNNDEEALIKGNSKDIEMQEHVVEIEPQTYNNTNTITYNNSDFMNTEEIQIVEENK